jgi:hypothetical protein
LVALVLLYKKLFGKKIQTNRKESYKNSFNITWKNDCSNSRDISPSQRVDISKNSERHLLFDNTTKIHSPFYHKSPKCMNVPLESRNDFEDKEILENGDIYNKHKENSKISDVIIRPMYLDNRIVENPQNNNQLCTSHIKEPNTKQYFINGKKSIIKELNTPRRNYTNSNRKYYKYLYLSKENNICISPNCDNLKYKENNNFRSIKKNSKEHKQLNNWTRDLKMRRLNNFTIKNTRPNSILARKIKNQKNEFIFTLIGFLIFVLLFVFFYLILIILLSDTYQRYNYYLIKVWLFPVLIHVFLEKLFSKYFINVIKSYILFNYYHFSKSGGIRTFIFKLLIPSDMMCLFKIRKIVQKNKELLNSVFIEHEFSPNINATSHSKILLYIDRN